jgi:hypothetical protein
LEQGEAAVIFPGLTNESLDEVVQGEAARFLQRFGLESIAEPWASALLKLTEPSD